jgi:retron-type reverse transcriptase
MLDKHYVTEGLTLRWVLHNQQYVIDEIIKNLKNKKYKTPIAIEKSVKTENKERLLYYFDWHEKILQSAVAKVLTDLFEPEFSDSLHSYRKGHGTYNTLLAISEYMAKNPEVFIIKKDIKSYGDNISHNKLFEILETKIDKKDYFYEVVKKIIQFKYYSADTKELKTKSIGLPTGSQVNNIIANVFLMGLDKDIDKFKDKSSYFRYGDDICVATPYEDVAKDILNTLESYVAGSGLEFNKEKDGFFFFNKSKDQKESFKYLGLMVGANGKIFLSKEKEKELKNSIDKLILKVNMMFSKVSKNKKQKVDSIIGSTRVLFSKTQLYNFLCTYLPVANDEDYWERIDHWVASRILHSVYGMGGDALFAKYPFKEMREKGLISIRHLRRILLKDKRKMRNYIKE